MSVREWLEADCKLFALFETVCKFDVYVDDIQTKQPERELKHIMVVQNMFRKEDGWERWPRTNDVANFKYDDAWITRAYTNGCFCKNQLYLNEDQQLHLSDWTCGTKFDCHATNPFEQMGYDDRHREVNVLMSMQEARELLHAIKNKLETPVRSSALASPEQFSVREWFEADPTFFKVFETICKHDSYIDDHVSYREQKHALKDILVVQRMQESKEGWQRMPRQYDVAQLEHDHAWICPYHPHASFCKNPLYLKDDKLHLTTMSTGLDYQRDSRNPCVQVSSIDGKREINVAMSLVEARALLYVMQQAKSTPKEEAQEETGEDTETNEPKSKKHKEAREDTEGNEPTKEKE